MTPSEVTSIVIAEWTSRTSVSLGPFTVSTPPAFSMLTFAGTVIGFFARRDIVRKYNELPDLEEGFPSSTNLTSFLVGENSLRRRNDRCAKTVLHAVCVGACNV